MLWRMLKQFSQSFRYEEKLGYLSRADPSLLVMSVLVNWVAIGFVPYRKLLYPLMFPIILAILAGRRIVRIAIIPIFPVLILALVAAVFSPFKPLSVGWIEFVLVVFIKAYAYALTAITLLEALGPLGALQVAKRIHPLLHDTVLLFYRTSPLIVSDSLQAVGAQRLLGKGVRDILIGITLSTVRRAESLHANLYLRGARKAPRNPPSMGTSLALGLSLLIASLISSLLPFLL